MIKSFFCSVFHVSKQTLPYLPVLTDLISLYEGNLRVAETAGIGSTELEELERELESLAIGDKGNNCSLLNPTLRNLTLRYEALNPFPFCTFFSFRQVLQQTRSRHRVLWTSPSLN